MSRRRWQVLVAALAAIAPAALAAAPALADSSQSSNWAGYAVHREGVTFTAVSGAWTQPAVTCTPGQLGYASFWVGLGGYSASSQALEQVGTEADCTTAGQGVDSAWYELVPAPSRRVRLTVAPGDRIHAAVTVTGHRVTVALRDVTRHTLFTHTLTAAAVDLSSAEWIVEAPSECTGTSALSCRTLPLADFGSAGVAGAGARTSTGHSGAIADRAWTATQITMTIGGRRFITGGGGTPPQAATTIASPSPLIAGASAFTVAYRGASGSTASSGSGGAPPRASTSTAARLARPGRL